MVPTEHWCSAAIATEADISLLINGQSRSEISVLDRGFQYGDGLFETIAFFNGEAPLWERHLQRLSAGCRKLGITPHDSDLLESEVRSVLDGSDRQVIKLIVTRSAGGRGYFPPVDDAPVESTRIIYTRPWHRWSDEDFSSGIALHLCESRLATGSLLAGLKHLNRLEQVVAAGEIAEAGYREGVVCDADGFVVEGLSSNIFWIKSGKLFTPLLDRCGVVGVMRAEVMERAEMLGIRVSEVRADVNTLLDAEGVFLTNAVTGILPVQRICGNHFSPDAVPYILSPEIEQRTQAGRQK